MKKVTNDIAILGNEQPDEFDKEGTDISASIFKFSENNSVLKGTFNGFGDTEFIEDGVKKSLKIIFLDTENGRRSCSASYQIMDAIHQNKVENGDKLKITWLGKDDIKDGKRQLNQYRIQIIKA